MARVYSKQLVLEQGFQSGPTSFYSVPSGFVTVIKCISMTFGVNLTVGSLQVIESLSGAVLFGTGAAISDLPTHDVETAAMFGTWTLEFPQGISLKTTGTPVDWIGDFAVSGYELSLP